MPNLLLSDTGKILLNAEGKLADKDCGCCGPLVAPNFGFQTRTCGVHGICCGFETHATQQGTDCDGNDLGDWDPDFTKIYLTLTTTYDGCPARGFPDNCAELSGEVTWTQTWDPFTPAEGAPDYSPLCNLSSTCEGTISGTTHCHTGGDEFDCSFTPLFCEDDGTPGSDMPPNEDPRCDDADCQVFCGWSSLGIYSDPLTIGTSYDATLARYNSLCHPELLPGTPTASLTTGCVDTDEQVCVGFFSKTEEWNVTIFGYEDVIPLEQRFRGHYLKVWIAIAYYPDYDTVLIPYSTWEYNDPDHPFSGINASDSSTWQQSESFSLAVPTPADCVPIPGGCDKQAEWFLWIYKYSFQEGYEPPDDGSCNGFPTCV